MTKKFIRENWACMGESNIGKFGIGFFLDTDQVIASSVLLDLFQSFEDRSQELTDRVNKNHDDTCENAAHNFTRFSNVQHTIDKLEITSKDFEYALRLFQENVKKDIESLHQENKSLRDDVNYLREKILGVEYQTRSFRQGMGTKVNETFLSDLLDIFSEYLRREGFMND